MLVVRLVFLCLVAALLWTFLDEGVRRGVRIAGSTAAWRAFRRLPLQRRVFLAAPWVVLLLAAVAGGGALFDLGPNLRVNFQGDQLEHAAFFFILTLLAAAALPRVPLYWIFGAVIASGAGVELLQGLSVFQGAMQLGDWAADAAGAATAALPMLLVARYGAREGTWNVWRAPRPLKLVMPQGAWVARVALAPLCAYGLWVAFSPDHLPPPSPRGGQIEKAFFWFIFLQLLSAGLPRQAPPRLALSLLVGGALMEISQVLQLLPGRGRAGDWTAELVGVGLALASLLVGRGRAPLWSSPSFRHSAE